MSLSKPLDAAALRCTGVLASQGVIIHGERDRDDVMQFVTDYLKTIDFIALAALVIIAGASFYRRGTIWLLIAAIIIAIWGAIRLFGVS